MTVHRYGNGTFVEVTGQDMDSYLPPTDRSCPNVSRTFKTWEFLVRSWGQWGGSEHPHSMPGLAEAFPVWNLAALDYLAVLLCEEAVSHHDSNCLPDSVYLCWKTDLWWPLLEDAMSGSFCTLPGWLLWLMLILWPHFCPESSLEVMKTFPQDFPSVRTQ